MLLSGRRHLHGAFLHLKNGLRLRRFVLISESDIPLYDPLTFYLQLMSESRSYVNACPAGPHEDLMPRRWSDKMKTNHMNDTHWRKSSQWFAMRRKHAAVVVDDLEIFTR